MSIKMKNAVLGTVATACALMSLGASADGTITFGQDQSLSVGFGMRGSYTSASDGAPDGTDRSSDFHLDSARLYLNGALNRNVRGMINTEWDGNEIRILDAVGEFSVTPELNIWAGRLLSPSDRANMAGPYYSLGGGYWADVASRYGYNGGIFRGRDDGVVAWGDVLDGKLGYSIGAFQGRTFGIGSLTEDEARADDIKASDHVMVAGRLQYDFWDAEPGYYGTGNYLGAKDILSLGVAARYQQQGVLTLTGIGDYSSYNVDFLMEKRLPGAGAVSVEAAYYKYDTGSVIKSEQGKAMSAGLGYIFGQKLGVGQLQPFVRYQKFDADTAIDTKQADVGVNYIISGYSEQISAVYSKTTVTNAADSNQFVVAMQLQF